MIVITGDGLRWDYAQKYLSDVFKEQTMKMIKCDVRMFSQTKEQASPTMSGLTCMWGGLRTKMFYKPRYGRMDEDATNEPLEFVDNKGNEIDSIFNYFDKCRMLYAACGENPYNDNKIYYKQLSEIKNLEMCPSEEFGLFMELMKPYDIFWYHSDFAKRGIFVPGAINATPNPVAIPFSTFRHDKQKKREVYEFMMKRFRYLLYCIEEMTDDIIVVSADHGTSFGNESLEDSIDSIPLIVNRKVDLSDIRFQWDIKKLLLRLKS